MTMRQHQPMQCPYSPCHLWAPARSHHSTLLRHLPIPRFWVPDKHCCNGLEACHFRPLRKMTRAFGLVSSGRLCILGKSSALVRINKARDVVLFQCMVQWRPILAVPCGRICTGVTEGHGTRGEPMRLRRLLPCAVGSIPPFGICIRSAKSPNWDRRGIDGPKYFLGK